MNQKKINNIDTEKQVLLMVSGFGWSGSGAVGDFLLNNSMTACAGNDEIIFMWVFIKLSEKVKKTGRLDITSGEYEQLFCAKVPKHISSKRKEYYEHTFSTYFSDASVTRDEYSKKAEKFLAELQDINQPGKSKEQLDTRISRLAGEFIVFLYKTFTRNDKFVFFDNLLHPQQLSVLAHADLSYFDSVQIYCVDRDPRDQFYDHSQRYINGLGLWHIMKKRHKFLNYISSLKLVQRIIDSSLVKYCAAVLFVRMHRRKRAAFIKSLDSLESNHDNLSIAQIHFEDFVLNRKQIRDGIKNAIEAILVEYALNQKWEEGKHFDASLSRTNIGLYLKDRHQRPYRYIARCLAEHTVTY